MERIRADSLKALVAASSRHHFYFKSQFEHTLEMWKQAFVYTELHKRATGIQRADKNRNLELMANLMLM